jgi:hypothetical protein
VTWTKVSLKDAKIRATPKTNSPRSLSALDIFMGSWKFRTISDLGTEGDVLLRGTDGFLWRHGALLSMLQLDLES